MSTLACRRAVRIIRLSALRGWFVLIFLGLNLLPFGTVRGERLTVPLDGLWQIADSRSPDRPPDLFVRTAPVPGLAHLATPGFENVDRFFSREHLANRIRDGLAPADWLTNYWAGKVEQDRNYFWYRTTFIAPAARPVARLRINKAQFGTAVWLNGEKIGEYAGCFSSSTYSLEQRLRWGATNELVIRVGAHPAVLPDNYPTGSDFEKIRWTPGIYDSVSLFYCENPVIQSIQVAPRVATQEILVQTVLQNSSTQRIVTALAHRLKAWKSGTPVNEAKSPIITLEPGEKKTVLETLPVPGAHLWTPEDPFLYTLETRTGGDSVSTRFGMREFRFDGATRRAYLNGEVYYLRGSNITLHRFFEDPLSGDLPWKAAWVRKLLGNLPKQMHWNYFRFCIGPVPDRWLDICDEVGLLIQNEFFVWTGGPGWYPGYKRTYDSEEMIRQYRDWMRDNWNHPSVAVWDANNETKDASFGSKIIPAVRPLDLSERPWENSYNAPAGVIDPVEYHPYLMISGGFGKLNFHMTDLEKMDGKPSAGALPSEQNAPLINEYGWLWLNRDGSPTRLTANLYPQLTDGPTQTARQRLDLYAYLLAAKTEFWRAHRQFAGIIHFVYLTCSYPGVYTADHFRDVVSLDLDPAFADYVGEAFKPLGVYLNFFHPSLPVNRTRDFEIFLVNDDAVARAGTVRLDLENLDGTIVAQAECEFRMDGLGAQRLELPLAIPQTVGQFTLRARAQASGQSDSTSSRRWVRLSSQ